MTISAKQADFANEQARARGIDGKVRYHLRNMLDTNVVPLAAIEDVAVRQVLAVRANEKRYVSPAIGNSFFRTIRPRTDRSGERELTYPDYVRDRILHLADGARIIVMAGLNSRPQVALGKLYTRDISIHGFVISNASVSDLADAATLINRLLSDGRLRSRIATTLPLADAAHAHRLQESRGIDRPRGRIVVLPEGESSQPLDSRQPNTVEQPELPELPDRR